MLLSLKSVNYSIGGNQLLDDASLVVNETDRIAIIGRNGCGKSTVLKLLDRQIDVDAGSAQFYNSRILLVKQELPPDDKTPIDYLKESDQELRTLNDQVDSADVDDEALPELFEKINLIEEERYDHHATLVLLGLGISEAQQNQPMRELSGGIRMRIGLASALLQKPDVLLLDEPTNHLDLPAAIWLTEYLKSYVKPFVLVSHDRALLDAVCNTTYHLQNGKLTRYSGNFSLYLAQHTLAQEQAIIINKNTDKKVEKIQEFVDKHKANPKWARICSTREGWIENLEGARPECEYESPPIPIDFPNCSELQDPIIQAQGCSVMYGETLILSDVALSLQTKSRIGILGKNGEGKSTLVRMFMQQMVRVTGALSISSRLRIGYFSQEQSDIMDANLSILEQQKTAMESTDTNEVVLTHLLKFGFKRDKCNTLVGELSGGEKTRLAFAMIAAKKPNLIIMDEPTNHLDFETRESLIAAINSFNGAVVLVSHDWELLEKTAKNFWLVKDGHVKPYTHDLNYYRKMILNRTLAIGKASSTDAPKSQSESKKAPSHSIYAQKVTPMMFPSGEAPPPVTGKNNKSNNKPAIKSAAKMM